MDIQMTTANPTATAGASTTAAGKAASGKSAQAGEGAAFTQILAGEMSQTDTTEAASEAAAALATLIQLLPTLASPVQQASGVSEEQLVSEEQALPELLLQLLNGSEETASQLLQDGSMQQWFAQAQELLAAMSGAGAPAMSNAAASTASEGTTLLQAQHTLLTLASMMKQQPDNAVLKFLAQDLQKAVQPLLPELMKTLAPAAVAPVDSEAAAEMMPVAESKPEGKQASKAPSAHKPAAHAQLKQADSDASFDFTASSAQITVSKLDMLAAKNMVHVKLTADQPTSDAALEISAIPVDAAADHAASGAVSAPLPEGVKPQASFANVLKAEQQPMNANNFAEEMTQHVLKNMKITLADGISEAKLSLFPKNLGHVDVRITLHDGQLVAQFAADTAAGRQMLESQLSQLRQALQSQGLQVEKLEVTQNENMQSSMFQQRQQQPSGQEFRQGKKSSARYEQDGDFVQEIASVTQERAAQSGNSFDVTA